ncbi:MAG: hypothetical protein MJ252_10300 [archaeon]|nr:hypothetical protein [archaeon]
MNFSQRGYGFGPCSQYSSMNSQFMNGYPTQSQEPMYQMGRPMMPTQSFMGNDKPIQGFPILLNSLCKNDLISQVIENQLNRTFESFMNILNNPQINFENRLKEQGEELKRLHEQSSDLCQTALKSFNKASEVFQEFNVFGKKAKLVLEEIQSNLNSISQSEEGDKTKQIAENTLEILKENIKEVEKLKDFALDFNLQVSTADTYDAQKDLKLIIDVWNKYKQLFNQLMDEKQRQLQSYSYDMQQKEAKQRNIENLMKDILDRINYISQKYFGNQMQNQLQIQHGQSMVTVTPMDKKQRTLDGFFRRTPQNQTDNISMQPIQNIQMPKDNSGMDVEMEEEKKDQFRFLTRPSDRQFSNYFRSVNPGSSGIEGFF